MSRRNAYRRKAEAAIAEQAALLRILRARAKGAAADLVLRADREVASLEKKLAGARHDAERSGSRIASRLDQAWTAIVGSVQRSFERPRK